MGVLSFLKRKNEDEVCDSADHALRIAWVLPGIIKGGGGHRTILQRAAYLRERYGAISDVFVLPKIRMPFADEYYRDKLKEWYDFDSEGVYCVARVPQGYDCIVATSFDTARYVAIQDIPCKAYFIQDYEPWFFPVGDTYLEAENSYDLGLKGITLGRWLSEKLSSDVGSKIPFSEFGIDPSIYHPLDGETEYAICAAFQPEKSRRAPELMQSALNAIANAIPEVKIYTYGSAASPVFENSEANHEHLGILPPRELASLYNKCAVGISFSLTNPSRIPFEMMACGLPVIELDRESTRHDFPDDGVVLSKPTPSAIARQVLSLLDDKQRIARMREACARNMEGRTIERENEEFAVALLDYLEMQDLMVDSEPSVQEDEIDRLFAEYDAVASCPLLKASSIEIRLSISDDLESDSLRFEEPVFAIWHQDDQGDLEWVKGVRKRGHWRFATKLSPRDGALTSLSLHLYDLADQTSTCYAMLDFPFMYEERSRRKTRHSSEVKFGAATIPYEVIAR